MRRERRPTHRSKDPGGEEKKWYKVFIPVKIDGKMIRFSKYIWANDAPQALTRLNLDLSPKREFLPNARVATEEEKNEIKQKLPEYHISKTQAEKYGFHLDDSF